MYVGMYSLVLIRCRLLKVGSRAVLLVGAEFRLQLLDCVSDLNEAYVHDVKLSSSEVSSDSTRPSLAQSIRMLDSDSDNTTDTLADVNTCSIVDSFISASDGGRTAADKVASVKCVGETADVRPTRSCPVWTTFLEHYVKLGETHAYICGFTKNR